MFEDFLRAIAGVVILLVVFYAAARVITGFWGGGQNDFDSTQIGTVQMNPGVTYEQFRQVQTGMTLAEVAAVLGAYGMNTSNHQAGAAGIVPNPHMVDYSWPGNRPMSRVLVSFRQGKVSEKLAIGLPPPMPGELRGDGNGPGMGRALPIRGRNGTETVVPLPLRVRGLPQ